MLVASLEGWVPKPRYLDILSIYIHIKEVLRLRLKGSRVDGFFMISWKSGTFEKLGRTVKSPPKSSSYIGTQGDRIRYTEEVGLHLPKRSDHTSQVNRIEFPRVLPPLLLLLLLLQPQRMGTTSSHIVADMGWDAYTSSTICDDIVKCR